VLGHTKFNIVDLMICEWEDHLMKKKRRIPYAHIICSLLAKIIQYPDHCVHLDQSRAGVLDYISLLGLLTDVEEHVV
jgi:hypothetical protein